MRRAQFGALLATAHVYGGGQAHGREIQQCGLRAAVCSRVVVKIKRERCK